MRKRVQVIPFLLLTVSAFFAPSVWVHGVFFGIDIKEKDQVSIVEGELPPPISVTVRPGDSYWKLAQEYYDTKKYDVRKIVDAITRLNPDLDPGRLRAYDDTVILPRFEDVK